MTDETLKAPGARLLSLDLLRGFDMILLTVVGPLFWAVNTIWKMPEAVQAQFRHAWGGFTLWDLIMPLFLFTCGAAIPYALPKRLDANGRPGRRFWCHVLGRVALLWFCGLLVQGNLATLNVYKISPFNNTLQTIAVGYLIGAFVTLIPLRAVRVAIPALLLAAYCALLHLLGDYSMAGNFAAIVEADALTALLPAANQFVVAIIDPQVGVPYGGYTWFLTSLMFGFMTLCGAQCAEILRGAWAPAKKGAALAALGAVLLALGHGLVVLGVPAIKHIFTASFTLQAMGWSALLFAALYFIADVARLQRGWWFVTLFGQCALTAYMTTKFFGPVLDAAARLVTQGLPAYVGETYMPLVNAVATIALLTVVCWARRRMRHAGRPSAAAEPIAHAAPAAAPVAVQPDSGAVAERFRIPGLAAAKPIQLKPPSGPVPAPAAVPEKTASDDGPIRSTKTNLKLHS